MKWDHDQLAADLANHLRGNTDAIVWENMQMGPSGSPRPDCYRIGKSYAKFQPIAYEIKVSVADFRRDVTAGKWQSYLKYASGVVFAVPAGLINKADVPTGCGLIVRNEGGWRSLKAPTLHIIDTMPRDAWLKLLIDGIDREAKRAQYHPARSHHSSHRALRKKFGERVAHFVSDLTNAEAALENAIEQSRARRKSIADETDELIKKTVELRLTRERRAMHELTGSQRELAVALGLDPGVDPKMLGDAVHEAVCRLAADAEVRRLRSQFAAIQRALTEAHKPLPGETAS